MSFLLFLIEQKFFQFEQQCAAVQQVVEEEWDTL